MSDLLEFTDDDYADMGMTRAQMLEFDAKHGGREQRLRVLKELISVGGYKHYGGQVYRVVDSLGNIQQIDLSNVEHRSIAKDSAELRQIPESHFLNCPGLVGDMVREICEYSPQPYPSFAFAAAASTIGAIKGSYARLGNVPLTLSSNLYFFCFADTGKGKNEPRRAMMEVLKRAYQTEIITGRIRSDVGLLADISHSQGVKVILYDEAHHLFEAMKSRHAASYLTNVKEVLLRLFTEWSSPHVDPGLVLSSTSQIKPLCYPSVSYCGFGVSRGLDDAFSDVDFADGLISRFIFFFDDRPAVSLRQAKEAKEYEFERDARFLDIMERGFQARQYRQNLEGMSARDKGKYQFCEIPMTAPARDAYLAFSDEVTARINERSESGQPEIETRIVEQVGRISLTLADERVELEHVDWAIAFARMYIETIGQMVYNQHSSEDAKNCERIVTLLKKKKQAMTLTAIGKGLRTLKFRQVRELLGYLVSEGVIGSAKVKSGKRGPQVEQFFIIE